MKLKTALFAAAATLALAPAAHAYQGVYGAIGAGLSYVGPDRDFESATFDSEADYDNGIGVYTTLGYDFSSNWRWDILEFSYRQNDVRHLAGDGLGFSGWPTGLTGEAQSMAFMSNLIYDFAGDDAAVVPYVGLGIGMARVSGEYNGPNLGAGTIGIDDKGWEFAYQGIAGLAFKLAEGLALDLSYRFFETTEANFNGMLAGVPTSFNQEYNSHSLFAGLRWNFGGAPAPAAIQYKDCWDGSSVPVTADCPPAIVDDQTAVLDPIAFTVYFDYDKSNLTPEAGALVQEAAGRALSNDIDTVVVQGNTDTSGSSAYNQALSERRARVVRDALVANGVSADMIRIEAFGEDNPAKPTADGVREPLNRRSDVTISFE